MVYKLPLPVLPPVNVEWGMGGASPRSRRRQAAAASHIVTSQQSVI